MILFADPIHRQAPAFDELSTEVQILETGIKVVDLPSTLY